MSTLALRIATKAAQNGEQAHRSFFARLFDAMMASRMRRVQIELAHYDHLFPADFTGKGLRR